MLTDLNPEDLEKISKQYPYFSAAQVLLSKSYQRRQDHRFTDQVAHAALYSGNRERLFHWLKEEFTTTITESSVAPVTEPVIMPEKPVILQQKIPEQKPEPKEKPVPSADMSGLVNFILDEEGIVKPEGEKITAAVEEIERPEIPFHPEIEAEKPKTPVAEETRKPVPIPEMDDMQREILLEAIHSSIEMEVSEVDDADSFSAEKTAATEDEPATDDSYASWIYRRSQQVHFAEGAATPPSEDPATHDLGDWKHLSEEETTQEQDPGTDDPEIDELLNREENPSVSHRTLRLHSTDYEEHKRDIIERFIRQEPRITRGKTTDYSPGNIAKGSVEEDDTFVTETIAQLYARQGRLDKARKAFKKLIELHPEKSVYFAAQLKNLDKFKKP